VLFLGSILLIIAPSELAMQAEISKELEVLNKLDLELYDYAQSLLARRLKEIVPLVEKAKSHAHDRQYLKSCSKQHYLVPREMNSYLGVVRPQGHKGPF
jgi:hypothetical protein